MQYSTCWARLRPALNTMTSSERWVPRAWWSTRRPIGRIVGNRNEDAVLKEISRETQRRKLADESVKLHRRGTTFSNTANNHFAVDKDHKPMAEPSFRPQNPPNQMNKSFSLLKIDVSRLDDLNGKNNSKVGNLQIEVVARSETIGKGIRDQMLLLRRPFLLMFDILASCGFVMACVHVLDF